MVMAAVFMGLTLPMLIPSVIVRSGHGDLSDAVFGVDDCQARIGGLDFL
jgi:hypothetical protein